ncbi:type 2 lanthipeptide synthetase LanM [Rhizomonospora bruguierae]|uniref:type 2 lanthipeptide synthetase LanM n=1 Tax=Rhizomonospora bruguierae TaxID=1581705 RepID=UPI001BCCF4BE|nr:type 2 lanthipeptide synthetase LanM [Micromonospora sp. NBRC 107566]
MGQVRGAEGGGEPFDFDPGAWRPAAHLHERDPAAGDQELGRRRRRRWATTFGSETALEAGLRCLGLDEPLFDGLLGVLASSGATSGAEPPGAASGDAGRPAWVGEVTAVVADGTAGPEPYLAADDRLGLLRVVGPQVRGYQRRLHRKVTTVVGAGAAGGRLAALPDLLASAWPESAVTSAVLRTSVLELAVARVEDRLVGSTPEERFVSFVEMLGLPATRHTIWNEYPVLVRYVNDVLRHWCEASLELAARLCEDLPALDALAPGVSGLGEVVAVGLGQGDTHRRGRSVATIEFARGKVVYKPRSLKVDLAWRAVLDWFNNGVTAHRLRTPETLTRPGYGWAEFVERRGCATVAELAAFHWRLGALLALLHALHGVDVHLENVIASGADPVIIDLEALFHAAPAAGRHNMWTDPAAQLIDTGVTAVGILPEKMIIKGNQPARALDLSAVGSGGDQMTPIAVPSLVGLGTDAVRVVDEHAPLPHLSLSRPSFGGRDVDPAEFEDELVEGFTATYRRIATERARWLGPGGLVDGFAEVRLRYVARPTAYYGRVLLDSLHPDFLRDSAERDRALARIAVGADGDQRWECLVASELADLRVGDIPCFEMRPGERNLYAASGDVIADFLDDAPIARVRQRVEQVSEPALRHQVDLIHRTFESLRVGHRTQLSTEKLPVEPLGAEEGRAAALRIAHRLVDGAIRDGDDLGWIILRFVDELHWQVGAAELDLYSGLSGIGRFLSAVAGRTADPRTTEAALRVADIVAGRASRMAEAFPRKMNSNRLLLDVVTENADLGAFGPLSGTVYYLAHAAAAHDRPDLLDVAEQLLDVLALSIDRSGCFDLLAGAGGALLALLALHRMRPGSRALPLARQAAARLVEGAIPAGDGLGWPSNFGDRPLLGMSHGTSGIAYALARLHAVEPQDVYAATIEAALRYEAGTFDAGAGGWPDLRRPEHGGSATPLVAWCHGAPGIALSRIGILGAPLPAAVRTLATDSLADAELIVRRETFGAHRGQFVSQGSNVLCHGDLGNLEALVLAARRRGDDDAHLACLRALRQIVRHGAAADYRTEPMSSAAVPGLMYGLAGIGYNLLRLSDMDSVPSVLLLDPPMQAGDGRCSLLPAQTLQPAMLPGEELG